MLSLQPNQNNLPMTNGEKTYIDSYTGDESVTMFITFAIEQFKNHEGLSGKEAASILAEAGVLKHLEEYYDVLHTQSAQWLVAEINELILNHNTAK